LAEYLDSNIIDHCCYYYDTKLRRTIKGDRVNIAQDILFFYLYDHMRILNARRSVLWPLSQNRVYL